MKAPSEKHLEDWITANPNILWGDIATTELVARQFPLPSGRADLIVRSGVNIYVIELKRDNVNHRTLGQVLRYMHDLKQIWWSAIGGLPTTYNHRGTTSECLVSGLIIGFDTDENTIKSANAAGVDVSLYDYDGFSYSLTAMLPYYNSLHTDEEYALGVIGVTMREAYALRYSALSAPYDTPHIREIPSNFEKLWRDWRKASEHDND